MILSMEEFLIRSTRNLPFREIKEGEKRYLERYYLFTIPAWKIGKRTFRGRRFYIHRFIDSDPDRGLHDHPWRKAWTFLLAGWYWEVTNYGTERRNWFGTITGDLFHRVVLPTRIEEGFDPGNEERAPRNYRERVPVPCWTLFFHTVEHQDDSKNEKAKDWGFIRPIQNHPRSGKIYEPYSYKAEGNLDQWWLKAQTRKQVYGY